MPQMRNRDPGERAIMMEPAALLLCMTLGGLILYALVTRKDSSSAKRRINAAKQVASLQEQGHNARVCQTCSGTGRRGSAVLLAIGRTFLVGNKCRRCNGTGVELNCPNCGHNLTANTSHLCPECGTETNPERPT
jgi:RecJ-like exonuclease